MRTEDKEKSKYWEYKDVLVILNVVESTTEIQRSPWKDLHWTGSLQSRGPC